jgi:protease-4
MKKPAIGCLAAILVLSLGLNLFVFIGALVFGGGAEVSGPEPLTEKRLVKGGDEKIARIDITGMITSLDGSVEVIKRGLRQALDDEKVKAVLLYVNTPGGEVTASDTIYHAVKEANALKPVIVYMDTIAASGGYYIACAAREIVANETTLTGSIGVIMQTLNYRELMGKIGLEKVVFRSGDFKDMLSGSREMRGDEMAYANALVLQMYGKFVGIVAEARGLDVEALKAGVADGRVVTGVDALKEKLIDKTGYIEDAYQAAAEAAGISNPTIVRYVGRNNLFGFLKALGKSEGSGAEASTRKVEIDVSERLLPSLEPGQAYFLYGH